MLNKSTLQKMLDTILHRPLEHPLDETMVQKQQLVRLAALSYNQALSDVQEIFTRPGTGRLGEILDEVLEKHREKI